ncbi:metallophosphoesterase family protein [bacterium]|nr:metallophosphoesterase family protein [bacterium]
MIWFTSDIHFNHANIIKYSNRPYSSVDKMNSALIRNWNSRVGPKDTVYHIGDFMFKGGWQGGSDKPEYFTDQLNGTLVHILGNHDKNNSIKNSIRYAEIRFANRRWCLQHKPPEESQMRVFPTPDEEDEIYLVGHVHTAWKHKWINNKLVINVGTDVWAYMPRHAGEISGYADKCFREREENNE